MRYRIISAILLTVGMMGSACSDQPKVQTSPSRLPHQTPRSLESPTKTAPTITLKPNPTFTPTPNTQRQNTPTLILTEYVNSWQAHNNVQHGFTFEYPAIWKTVPFMSNCSLDGSSRNRLDLGAYISLQVYEASSQNLTSSIANIMQYADPEFTETTRSAGQVNGLSAITIDYNTYGFVGRLIYFQNNNSLYEAGWHAQPEQSSICDVPEIRLSEWEAFLHMLETFTFHQK
ncbi:MAG: hypothetical protein JNL09_00455 [Anaerolineales bacterium]|nr:hypothetical protein [Anaerolineales bacterium]